VTAAAIIGAAVMLRAPSPTDAMVDATIGSIALRYQSGYARFPAGREGGPQERLDLAAFFPGFAPAGALTGFTLKTDLRERNERTVFIALTGAEPTLEPADRPVKLYERFLEPDTVTRPDGLLERRFQAGSPYENEELFIAPPEGRAFFARCPTPKPKPDGLPDTCIYDFRTRGLDVEMRFSPALLADWQALGMGGREFVEAMLRGDRS
jgi:hypothetical protein